MEQVSGETRCKHCNMPIAYFDGGPSQIAPYWFHQGDGIACSPRGSETIAEPTVMKILSDGENPTTLFSTDSLFVIEIDGVQFHSTMLDWLLIHPNPDAAHRFERKGNVVVNHTFVSSSIKDQPGWSAAT